MPHMLQLWTGLTDVVFPPTCGGCGVSTSREGSSLCWDCRGELTMITKPICSVCGVPVHGRIDHDFICHECTARPPLYTRARAAILYNALGRRLITRYKYNHALWLERLLTDLVEKCVNFHFEEESYDLVCPVPLHAVKQRERGYNQARLLASRLSKRLDVPLAGPNVLIRIKKTDTQTRLTARQRLSNVLGAFKVHQSGRIAGKKVLLIDDVMTTGATVGVCSKVLMDAGAGRVDVVTVARGT